MSGTGEKLPRQVRYYLLAGREAAERAYAALDEAFFETEGAPVAMTEIDEKAQRFEVSAYLDTPEGTDRREAFARAAGIALEEAVREDLDAARDWMADVLAALKPVRAGRFLVHGAHDADKVRPGDLSILIEAGQAFGTGHHGTTAGCLEMIEALVRRRRPVNALDLGTGSAVLAIGLALLARVPVLATDIDPVATKVAAGNAAANGVSQLVKTVTAAGFDAPAVRGRAPYDFIVANILAGPLMRLAPQFEHHLAPGGDIVLSGILATQRRAVLAAFRNQELVHRGTLQRGDWVTLHLSR
ncbi:50S ribosomal protein L11 methyltransferase [Aurantimonas sp. Leaf443]|uniref:50S ribosomal protein L11 methyltransferase n=1 Tax=Aurantimonas sp. Leaf443 TaxID=1736378 RepID=UPI0006F838C1|nr:50S ribosomal protein L11 methyltransferase [Aurantimonas sp. Leaf443]KQT86064.1 ribosomal protein L11 methyltransferase [Aurantimonas sp. Leaf443]